MAAIEAITAQQLIDLKSAAEEILGVSCKARQRVDNVIEIHAEDKKKG
jgi:hypothetical protein